MLDETARARRYYDAFAASYERHRDGRGRYHDLVDQLEVELVSSYLPGASVLEVGCGTGLLLRHFAARAARAVGVDLSPAMVERARARGLDVVVGDALALPFADASFDLAVSFKVLAHVPSLAGALAEMSRVVRPGGRAIIELYNPHSLRGALRRFGPSSRVAEGTDRDVLCRFDDGAALRKALPSTFTIERVRGIRSITPAAFALEIPGLGPLLERMERAMCDGAAAARWAGFVCYVLRRGK